MWINNVEIRTGPEDDPELVCAVVRALKGTAYSPEPCGAYQELTMPTRALQPLQAQATRKLPALKEPTPKVAGIGVLFVYVFIIGIFGVMIPCWFMSIGH